MSKLRRTLYRTASLLGDVESIQKGTFIKRAIRKQAYKKSSSIFRKILKLFGL